MWWNICGSNGHKSCVRNKKSTEKAMRIKPSEIAKAKEMARNWKAKK
jgi:hypothetical protein